MPLAAARAEERVVLHEISWATYERLLEESGEHRAGTRFAYNDGDLEIMVVYAGHENPNRTLAQIATVVAEETGRDFWMTGSTTFNRQDLLKGVEPDSSFYFRDADVVRGKDRIDLALDPPPELIIEVDMSRSSLPRFPIFAALGVAEVWRYDGERVRFYALEGNQYQAFEESTVLPPMTAGQAAIFLERVRQQHALAWLSDLRDWIRAAK